MELMLITHRKRKASLFTKSLCLYFLLLPLGMVNIGSMGSLLRIAGILPLAAFFFNGCPKIRVYPQLKGELLFTSIAIISMIWSIDREASWERVFSQILLILLILPIGAYKFDEDDISLMKRSLIWASRISVVLPLVDGFTAESRLFLNGFFTEDPNLLPAYFVFGMANAFIVFLDKEVFPGRKVISLLELLLYVYVTLLTGSRGGLLAIIAGFAILFLFYNKVDDHAVFIRKIVIVGLFFLASGMVLSWLPDQIIARYTLQSVIESRGTHRIDIWQRAFNIFSSTSSFRRIFGFGYNTSRAIFISHGYPSKVMHNVFIEYLMEIGVVGLIIYIYSLWCFIKPSLKVRDMYSFSIIICMIFLSFSTNIIAFKPYWNILLYSMCAFICKTSNSQEEDQHS